MDAILNLDQRIFYLPRPSRLVQYLKARLLPPDIEAERVSEVLKHYGLELLTPPGNLPFGRRNRLVLVDTSTGKKVLKLYKSWWPSETIHYEHSILNHLEQINFSAPRLCRTLDQDTLVSLDGQHFSLFEYIEGTSFNWSYIPRSHRRKLYTIAGTTLAEFHRRMEGFSPDGVHHLGFRSYSGDRWRDMAWHINSLRRSARRSQSETNPENKMLLDWLGERSNYILEELSRLDELLRKVSFPRTVIHGDYGVHNLEIHRNGTVTVHDFELARLEWRLIDMVAVFNRIDFERIQYFIRAYQSEYPILPEEWRFLPQIWQLYMLQGAVQSWDTYFEVGGSHRLVSAQKRVKQAEWALKNQAQWLRLRETAEGGYR